MQVIIDLLYLRIWVYVIVNKTRTTSIPFFHFLGLDGKTKVPQEYFPNAKESDLKISGYDLQFTATTELSPCTNKYSQTASHFDLFSAPVYQRLRVTYDKPQEAYGIHLHRYILSKEKLKVLRRVRQVSRA